MKRYVVGGNFGCFGNWTITRIDNQFILSKINTAYLEKHYQRHVTSKLDNIFKKNCQGNTHILQ